MTDVFTGDADPLDLIATYNGVVSHRSDMPVARMSIADGTDHEAIEINCPIDGSTYSSHRCAPEDLEGELARYLDLQWPAEHRLEAIRARAEIGGEYEFGGDSRVGLYVTEPPIMTSRN